MPKTVQIRDIEDDVYAALVARAAEQQLTVPEFLRRETRRIASRPSVAGWLEQTRGRRPAIAEGATGESLDALRGPRPGS